MTIKRTSVLLALTLLLVAPAAYARETGAPLVTYPIKPCRVFDTRVNSNPIPANTAVNIHVRGSSLPSSQGPRQADCGVPPSAEAVMLNVVAIMPTAAGVLIVDYPILDTSYSRLNYNAGQTIANEMLVSLCNANSWPLASHIPCLWSVGTGGTVYLDAQILNLGSSSVHVLADVTAYLAAAP